MPPNDGNRMKSSNSDKNSLSKKESKINGKDINKDFPSKNLDRIKFNNLE